jgi:hypothetical protein
MVPQGMPGAAAHGAAGLKTALELLQKSLPTLPMGSKVHTAVLKAVTELSRAIADEPQGGGDSSAIIQQLVAAQRAQQQQPHPPMPQMPNMGGGAPPAMAA